MKINWKRTLWLSSLSVLISPLVQAQYCTLTNASVKGAYGYVASEAGAVVTTTSTTGATGTGATTSTYSNTGIGQLLNGISAGNQFALGGVWVFDGVGSINATSTPGGAETVIGTYNVNSDCSITVSVEDVFGTTTAATQLAGVVLGGGSEIDLTSASSLKSTTTSSTSTTTTTTSGSGLAIKLVRVLYQYGCSDSNLSGLYGFVLNPTAIQTQTTTTTTGNTGSTTTTSSVPSVMIGYLDFDGAGHITTLASTSTSSSSTFTSLQYTGTYTVNVDCSGTMTISPTSTSSTSGTTGTTTGTTSTGSLTVNFVITPPATPSGNESPGLDLSFSNAAESGSGYALVQ